ncbi:MAG TPA: PEGA domain-containing protein [Myxococcaceae bacterium]|nr:PEGA domain-containing protein [Myxococcaceae bacterium]
MLSPLLARAETPGLVLGLAAHDSEVEPLAVAASIEVEARLRSDPRFTLVDPARQDWEEGSRARLESAARGRMLLEEARALYRGDKLASAADKADAATRLLAGGPREAGISEFVEALGFWALVAHSMGEAERALDLLQQLVVLAPGWKPEKTDVPKFAELVARARSSMAYAPRMALQVRSRPASGQVFVDGVLKGASPLRLGDLAPGRHLVTVLAPGYLPFHTEVTSSMEAVVDAVLEPSASGEPLRTWRAQLGRAVSRDALVKVGLGWAQKVGAGQALVASVGTANGKLRVVAARVVDGPEPIVVYRAAEVAGPAEVAALVAGLLEQPMAAPSPALAKVAGTRSAEVARGRSRRPWVYLAVGAAAAAGIAGGMFGKSAYDQASFAQRLPQTDHVGYDKAIAGAQTTSIVANCLYSVSLASAGAAAWLLLTGREDSGGSKAGPAPVSVNFVPLQQGGSVVVEGSFR